MMNREIKIITNCFLAAIVALLLVTCAPRPQSMAPNGTAQAVKTYRSNGERIYFSSTSDRGTNITYTGEPSFGGMMRNGSSGGMMGNRNGSSGSMSGAFLTCASCHGADGRGDVHTMMGMQIIAAKDIRWSALKKEFDAEKFRLAVTKGQNPDGAQLKQDMPRWNIGKADLADLIAYLKTLT